jgi:hypothetical protein
MNSADANSILDRFLARRCIYKDHRLFMTVQVVSIDTSDWGAIFRLLPLATWSDVCQQEEPFEVSASWDFLSCQDRHLCTKLIGWELDADPEIIQSVEAVGRRYIAGQDRVYALLAAFRGHGDKIAK